MLQPIVIFFVILASVFAAVHWFAVSASLYWHFWWFDILMHFWGGILIALGVVSLTTFRRITIRPTYKLVFLVSAIVVVSWEFFEWQVGLFDLALHFPDALYDIALGLIGGLLGYWGIKHLKI